MRLKIKIFIIITSMAYLLSGVHVMLRAQSTILSISGNVMDENNGSPVVNHLMMVNVSGAGFSEDYELYTDNGGFYGNDSIWAPVQGLISVSTLDCYNDLHFQEANFDPVNTQFVFDFMICSDSTNMEDCENWFWFETWNNLDFTFFGESMPAALEYFWDFGDGNTAYGQMVDPSYNVNELVYVTLTTISYDPAGGDSCLANSTQEVWVGNNNNDCLANFEYAVDSSPAGNYIVQFADLSSGEPNHWLWDFGDGNFSEEQNPQHTYYFPGTYFVCLTIYGDSSNCYDTYCNEVAIGQGWEDCENWFWHETIDSITFNFFGESAPIPADEWHWDFGDGSVANGPVVTHTFDPGMGSEFNVSLYTVSYDPLSGDSCSALSSQWIWVGDTTSCVADFSFVQDSLNELTVAFFDNSSGQITNWLWDFGDGTTSEEVNPEHVFPGPSIYQVCLTVTDNSWGYLCSDTYCIDIEVDFELEASFISILDTLSGLTNNYFFTDVSTGNANTWNWGFGDGSTSVLQNPIHQYSQPGTYEVCLEVSREFPGFGIVSDFYCSTINTPNYYDFGGQVFIDGFPLNNSSGDTTIVDTGIAYLYRKYANNIIPVDTNVFYNYGYYWFTNIREGEYLVKAGLTENSLNYKSVAPSYYENELQWNCANTLNLTDTNYYVNIDLVQLAGIGQGIGSISGYLSVTEKDFINSLLISQLEILLFDEEDNPLTFITTDEFGSFTFQNIPLGSYTLFAEATGFVSFDASVVLDEANPSVTDIHLELFEQSVGTESYQSQTNFIGKIYPNPLQENLYLNVDLVLGTKLKIDVFNVNGHRVLGKKIVLSKGTHIINLDVAILPKGVYLLTIVSGDEKIIETRKFIK